MDRIFRPPENPLTSIFLLYFCRCNSKSYDYENDKENHDGLLPDGFGGDELRTNPTLDIL